MITKKDIQKFIDEEQAQLQREIDSYIKLSIEEKVKARKAIVGLHYDKKYFVSNGEYGLCRFIVRTNQSSLGVGDSVTVNGHEATLWDFDNGGNLILGFWGRAGAPLHCFSENEEIVIEKQMGNFLASSYRRFMADLPDEDDNFWKESVLPSRQKVEFDGDIEKWKQNIIRIEEELGITLLDSQREAISRAFAAKDYYMLQGPPGTGKSFVIALLAIILAFKYRERVCIAGPNYMAINNALVKIAEIVPQCVQGICKVGYPYQTAGLTFDVNEESITIQNLHGYLEVPRVNELKGLIMGMTPYTFYSSRAKGIKFDTVIIDESGQMSVPVAMMAATNCKKLILCGDHKQLTPIIKAERIAEPLKQSVFKYMLDDNNCTMIDTSFRMNGPICRIVSDLFYDGKLKAYNPDKRLMVEINDDYLSSKFSVVAKNIKSDGRQSSNDEAKEIDLIIKKYSSLGVSGKSIGILAPFRAQCGEIRRILYRDEALLEEYKKDIVVDTIDKLQGQEREIIIISLTSGDIEYINELSEFLYNPNKLNVAISRAKCKLIILGNFDAISKMDGFEGSYIQKILIHPDIKIFQD